MPKSIGPNGRPKVAMRIVAHKNKSILHKAKPGTTVVHQIYDSHTAGKKWLDQSGLRFDVSVQSKGAKSEFRVCSMLIDPKRKKSRTLAEGHVHFSSAKSPKEAFSLRAKLGKYHSRWGTERQMITYLVVRNQSKKSTANYEVSVGRSKPESTNAKKDVSEAKGDVSTGKTPPSSARHEIVVKSYIGRIGKNLGRFPNQSKFQTTTLFGFGQTADKVMFAEDPKEAEDDQVYRIYTRKLVRAHCMKGKAKYWNSGNTPAEIAGGYEPATWTPKSKIGKLGLKSPNPKMRPEVVRLNGDKLYLEFFVFGEPPPAAHKLVETLIKNRSCKDIWYKIKAQFSCVSPKERGMKVDYIKLDRSQFPSVRVWYNGKVFKGLTGTGVKAGTGTALQNDVVTLFNCIPNTTRVR
jgi:hypothetical protein